jgi:poly(3-hydroxybutyrate) depolymerase
MFFKPTLLLLVLLFDSTSAVRPSSGCTTSAVSSPVSGQPEQLFIQTTDATQQGGLDDREYWLNMPKAYDGLTPAKLIFDLHGFYDTAYGQILEDLLPEYVNSNSKNIISVYPLGSHDGGQSAGWNADGNGFNKVPGPEGLICQTPRTTMPLQVYTCFDSCKRSQYGCNPLQGCDAGSCMDDHTFIDELFEHMAKSYCIDLDHFHVTGMSAGAIMTYSLPHRIHNKIASIAPACGSNFLGYNTQINSSIAMLDMHGFTDIYVPANISGGRFPGPRGSVVSDDYFYYTPTENITKVYANANKCDFSGNLVYKTKWDGMNNFSCNRPHGNCARGDVVQCTGNWGHTWPLHDSHPQAYAELIVQFFEENPRRK